MNLLKGLPRDRFRPILVCLYHPGQLEDKLRLDKIETIALGLEKTNKIATVFKIIQLLNKEKPDIVHTFLYPAQFWGRIAAILAGVPIILASEESIYSWKSKLHYYTDFIFSLFGNYTVAVSKTVRAHLIKKTYINPNKVKVIYVGVDGKGQQAKKDFRRLRKALGIRDNSFVIGTVSRLVPQKGHIYLLEAAKLIKRKHKNVVFLIVGDGRLKQRLLKKAAESNLSRDFRFLGTRLDVPDLLEAMDAFVFPSLWEGFPVALAEAMYQGKAVVASDIPQIREMVVNDSMGILVPSKNGKAIVQAINRLIDNPRLRESLGKRAKAYAANNLNLETMIRNYRDLYFHLLNNHENCKN